ncbi:MAG: hypothetical protein PHY58_14295, partial [Bacteroidales bacterium]|nr:hypothetical protein [Bacteroidales bacterium]
MRSRVFLTFLPPTPYPGYFSGTIKNRHFWKLFYHGGNSEKELSANSHKFGELTRIWIFSFASMTPSFSFNMTSSPALIRPHPPA